MTDEQKIDAVTARLTGTFVIGERVRIRCVDSHLDGLVGVVIDLDALSGEPGARLKLEHLDGVQSVLRPWYRFADLEPA